MSNYESKIEHNVAQAIRKLIQQLNDNDFIWGRDELRGLGAETALKVIVQTACDQGGISGLGNLEETLIQIAKATSPNADLNKLESNQGIADQPSPEKVLSALEKLATKTYSLSSELAEVYLQNLELQYTSEITACEQESNCINSVLATAVKRAVSTGIDGEQIKEFRSKIESWAYLPEAA